MSHSQTLTVWSPFAELQRLQLALGVYGTQAEHVVLFEIHMEATPLSSLALIVSARAHVLVQGAPPLRDSSSEPQGDVGRRFRRAVRVGPVRGTRFANPE